MVLQLILESKLKNTTNFHLQISFTLIFRHGLRDFGKVKPDHDWLKFADIVEWSDIAWGKNVRNVSATITLNFYIEFVYYKGINVDNNTKIM